MLRLTWLELDPVFLFDTDSEWGDQSTPCFCSASVLTKLEYCVFVRRGSTGKVRLESVAVEPEFW